MATYLKNTYIDGSLVVEGDLKVKNIDLSNADIPVLDLENTYGSAKNRIVRTGNDVPAELRPTGLAVVETVGTGNARIIDLELSSETFAGSNNPNLITQFNIVRRDSSSATSTVMSIQSNTVTNGFKACVAGKLYLWDKTPASSAGDTPDYEWHFTAQNLN